MGEGEGRRGGEHVSSFVRSSVRPSIPYRYFSYVHVSPDVPVFFSMHVLHSDLTPDPMSKKVSVEEQYIQLTDREEALHRPDTFLGAITPQTDTLFVWKEEEEQKKDASSTPTSTSTSIVSKTVTFVPAFYKIVDEIMVNAQDQSQRYPTEVKEIGIRWDIKTGEWSVYNDGPGIAVEMHKTAKMYVPEFIFGHVRTSDKYDDTEKRTTGGRNGYGAKLTNIFSVTFTVETYDAERKLLYRQTWTDNMAKVGQPNIQPIRT